ncbi:MAG: type II secretion system F family protein [Candidatus Accumulibacter sp.]|jgi:type IV pilus assembly protein PilC|nr:type II secretion system F family protein [Accumulibacter sp.]
MPIFDYRAIDSDGRAIAGRLDALNLIDLETRLKRMELDLIDGTLSSRVRRSRGLRHVPRRELIHFCFHLEHLIRAGVPILDGLADLRDSLENPRFREIIASLIEGIEGGQTLSQAMEAHPRAFGRVFVSLIHAGEASGRLSEVLRSLTDSLKWEDELVSQTRKLALYPVFVGGIVVLATFFLMWKVVPELKQFVTHMGETLPPQTRALFFISDLLADYWYIALGTPILLAAGIRVLIEVNPLARLRFDALLLRLPFFGEVLRKIALSRFANTFALLYASGIPIIDAVHATRNVIDNLAVQRGLEHVEQLIGEGLNVASAFQRIGFFPPLVIRMLRVGENTGALDEALTNVCYFYNRDVRESVEKAQQLIEPALTLLLGGLLGWIMLSVLGPVYDVISRINL